MTNVGAPPVPLSVAAFTLIGVRRSFAGPLIGAEQINEAYERVLSSKVRYRAVIDTSTLDPADA